MPAYNTLNGIPCNSHKWLLVDLLRKEWGFDGFTGSDYAAVQHLWDMQFLASGKADAARQCLLGGLDVEWPERPVLSRASRGGPAGRVPRAVLDESVRRVLRVKDRVGLS